MQCMVYCNVSFLAMCIRLDILLCYASTLCRLDKLFRVDFRFFDYIQNEMMLPDAVKQYSNISYGQFTGVTRGRPPRVTPSKGVTPE